MHLLAPLHFSPAPATEQAGKMRTSLGWPVVPLCPVLSTPCQCHSSAGMSGGAWRSTRHPWQTELRLQVGRNSSQEQRRVWVPWCRSGMLLDKHSLHKSFCLGVFVSSLDKTNVDVGPDFSMEAIPWSQFISAVCSSHLFQVQPLCISCRSPWVLQSQQNLRIIWSRQCQSATRYPILYKQQETEKHHV